MSITIKRIYDAATPADGYRVLVDRLWPRGVTKGNAHLDAWERDLAPSPELRTWWDHDPARLDEFAARYRAELDGNPEAVAVFAEEAARAAPRPITLLYAATDPVVNHARILAEYLNETLAEAAPDH